MMARSASFLTWIDSSFLNFSSAARRHALPCSPPKRGRSVAVGPSTVGVEWCLCSILKNAAASAYNTDEDDEEGRRQSCEEVMRSDMPSTAWNSISDVHEQD